MTAIVKEVRSCQDCPFVYVDAVGFPWCMDANRGTIPGRGLGTVGLLWPKLPPEWCPLRDYDVLLKLSQEAVA